MDNIPHDVRASVTPTSIMALGSQGWFNGLPRAVLSGDGAQKYWFNGLPMQPISTAVNFVFVIHPFV